MPQMKPFVAWRYPDAALDSRIAPPHWATSHARREVLGRAHEHNVVHLDQPQGGKHKYVSAGVRFDAWRKAGAVVRDPEPAFYVLEQQLGDAVRRGLVAAVRLHKPEEGVLVTPAELREELVEDRFRLLEATQAQASLPLGLFTDKGARALLGKAASGAPVARATLDGVEQRLFRVSERAAQEELAAALEPARVLLADGHHRIAAALRYREQNKTDAERAWMLACLMPIDDPGLTVRAVHRTVNDLDVPRPEPLREACAEHFEVTELEFASVAERREALANAKAPSLCLCHLDGSADLLTLKNPGSEPVQALGPWVADEVFLPRVLGVPKGDPRHARVLGYEPDAVKLAGAVEGGAALLGLMVPELDLEHVRSVTRTGAKLPYRGVVFEPVIPAGLLVRWLKG